MCAAVVLASFPLWSQAPEWTGPLLAIAALARPLLSWRGLALPSLPVRLVVLFIGIATIYFSYGTFFGMEPGFGILLVLVSMKVLETKTPRDFVVLTLLGFFLGLCALFFSQDLTQWLYVGCTCGLLLAAVIRLYQGDSSGALLRSVRLAAVMTVQAVPLVVLCFLFCPRPRAEIRLFLGASQIGGMGMSDHLQPGSVSSLVGRSELAFRASFPDGNIPPPQAMYWRGVVLWACDGLVWDRGTRLEPEPAGSGTHGPAIRQIITLEPHGANWLFALDRPTRPPRLGEYAAGGTLRSHRPLLKSVTYEVVSELQNRETVLSHEQMRAATRPPQRVSPAVKALAESFRTGAGDEREIALKGLDYFRKGNFTYSLSPGTYDSSELDEFLFTRRLGYCEHYAAAFATLMRLAGVPSRVVGGYLGGSYNEIGNYLNVTQADAHAWCEVWVTGTGWLRIDPTSVTAPDRINLGLQSFLNARQFSSPGAASRMPGGEMWRDLARRSTMFWNNLDYQWNSRVLSFDDENQRSFFAAVGLGRWQSVHISLGLMIAGAAVLAGLALWMRRPSAVQDPAARWFARFCRRAAAAGVPRGAAEGPLAYTARAAQSFPLQAASIHAVGRIYAETRYGRVAPPACELAAAVRQIGRLRHSPAAPAAPSE